MFHKAVIAAIIAFLFLIGVAPAGGSQDVLASAANYAPPEPKYCSAPVASQRGERVRGTQYSDELCGTRGNDTLIAIGGGDHAWGYQGADDLRARNGRPDEIFGGPGIDKGRFDQCDRVADVERAAIGGRCAGIRPHRLLAAAELPYDAPVVECYRGSAGERIIDILVEPQMRAIDSTARVDFQTVAWSAGILRIENGTPVFVGRGSWFWDRPYDEQVEAFPGNYWRSFTTKERTFVSYTVSQPGTYVLGVYLHWYATKESPARDEIAIARAHYGPAEQADHTACEFRD